MKQKLMVTDGCFAQGDNFIWRELILLFSDILFVFCFIGHIPSETLDCAIIKNRNRTYVYFIATGPGIAVGHEIPVNLTNDLKIEIAFIL